MASSASALLPWDGGGGAVRPHLQLFWLVLASRACGPTALAGATWWLLRSPVMVVRRLASGADETMGLSPRNLCVSFHDFLLDNHYLGEHS